MNAPTPTVLVVEDNPTEVMLIRRAFAKAGIAMLDNVHIYWLDLNVRPTLSA
jgi:hypothetical protein